MNAWIKAAAIFAVGALSGGGVAYLVLDRKYAKLLDEQTEDLRGYYRKRIVDLQDVLRKKEGEAEDLSSRDLKDQVTEGDYAKLEEQHGFVDYTSFARPEVTVTSRFDTIETNVSNMRDELEKVSRAVHDDDFDEHMAERESPYDDEMTPEEEDDLIMMEENERREAARAQAIAENVQPYPLTRAEFLNQRTWNEKISWTLYKDGVVTDETGEVVDDVKRYLGDQLMEAFGIDGDDPDVAYIGNDQLETDFEICRVMDCYGPLDEDDGLTLSSEG